MYRVCKIKVNDAFIFIYNLTPLNLSPEMTKITKRLFSAIKERNDTLINEYSTELQAKWKDMNASGNSDMDEKESSIFSNDTNEALEFAMEILSQKRQASEMTDGFIRELAAGCYRSEIK